MNYTDSQTKAWQLPSPAAPRPNHGKEDGAEGGLTQPHTQEHGQPRSALRHRAVPCEVVDVGICELKTAAKYSELFARSADVLDRVTKSIRESGFDKAHAISVDETGTVLDGHTRLEAAKRAGIQTVPVRVVRYETDDEKIRFAIRCQTDRRNLSDTDIITAVKAIDQYLPRGGAREASPDGNEGAQDGASEPRRSSAITGAQLGVSARKIEQARQILAATDRRPAADVTAGKISINAACTRLRKRASERRVRNPDDEERELRKALPLLSKLADIAFHHCPRASRHISAIESEMNSRLKVVVSQQKGDSSGED